MYYVQVFISVSAPNFVAVSGSQKSGAEKSEFVINEVQQFFLRSWTFCVLFSFILKKLNNRIGAMMQRSNRALQKGQIIL